MRRGEMTNTWPHCFRDTPELMLNGDTDGHSAILTSNTRDIRQELLGHSRGGGHAGTLARECPGRPESAVCC